MRAQVYAPWAAALTAFAASASFVSYIGIQTALARRLTASSIRFHVLTSNHVTDDRIAHENESGCHDVV